jgi:hypothetical protein
MAQVSRSTAIAAFVLVLAWGGVFSMAGEAAAQTTPAAGGCESDAHREFDF